MGKSKKTIDKAEKARVHGIMSASYERNRDAEKRLAAQGYTLDKQLSGRRAKVFVDPNGKASVVYRGTQNAGDVLSDIALSVGLGKYTNRVKHSKKVYKQTQQKYGHHDVDTYGHSLGGYLAENVGNKSGQVTTFNKASIGSKPGKNQIDIRTNTDLISMMTPKHKGLVEMKGSSNPLKSHSVDSLIK